MAAAALAPSIRSLICTSPLAFSSRPWMTTQGELRWSAYLICVADLARIAEIELGADAGVAQPLHHALIVGDAVLVEHGDDHRAGLGLRRRSCRDACSAASRRDTPMEKPVAGTGSPRKRDTRPS